MANPSISVPDDLLDAFDEKVDEMRRSGELDLDTSRSEVIQALMRQWVEGNSTSTPGTLKQTTDVSAD